MKFQLPKVRATIRVRQIREPSASGDRLRSQHHESPNPRLVSSRTRRGFLFPQPASPFWLFILEGHPDAIHAMKRQCLSVTEPHNKGAAQSEHGQPQARRVGAKTRLAAHRSLSGVVPTEVRRSLLDGQEFPAPRARGHHTALLPCKSTLRLPAERKCLVRLTDNPTAKPTCGLTPGSFILKTFPLE